LLSLSGPGGWYTVLADHTIATLTAHAAKPVVGVTAPSTTGISNAVLTADGKVIVWGPGTTTMMP
jgi:hypothetical protein